MLFIALSSPCDIHVAQSASLQLIVEEGDQGSLANVNHRVRSFDRVMTETDVNLTVILQTLHVSEVHYMTSSLIRPFCIGITIMLI
jgi:hypothetical protein